MTSTPSSRLRLTPSNSPFLGRPSRSPIRPQKLAEQPARLSLKRVVGNTCTSPTGFDSVHSCFAYIAGGAVVVVDVQEDQYSQRFYRARPTATPTYGVSPVPHAPSTPNSTPKANDSRNRGPPSDWSDNSSSKTWSQRERIKAATCVSLSRDGRFLAVGETGFAPRVLIFNLQDNSSDIPLVSISEHAFGVAAVAWSKDTKYLASLGSANDGFLYIWKIDQRTGSARLFQQNRCTSSVRGMVWMGNSLVTFGVRHVKAWKVEEQPQATSPSKQKFPGDGSFPVPQYQKPLPGRNVLLGSLLEATFTCAAVIRDDKAILCSETGDISILDDSGKQMRLVRATNVEFPIQCVSACDQTAYLGGKSGQFVTIDVAKLCDDAGDCVLKTGKSDEGTLAMGFIRDRLVTIDARRSIAIWSPGEQPAKEASGTAAVPVPIPGYSDAIMGVGVLSKPNPSDSAFFTWSGCGKVVLWGSDGSIKSSFEISVEQPEALDELEPPNELRIVAASKGGQLFVTADRLGVLKVVDFNTKECLLDTKAHASMCQVVAIYEYEDNTRAIIASCGRDRTAQLFRRTSTGTFEHFQTLEFAAKVVHVLVPSEDKVITCSMDRTLQIHDIVSKEGDPDLIAAIPSRVITLKGSPSSMVMDDRSVFVSLLDRSVCQYDISTGRLLNTFKCMDEGGAESVVLDSLIYGQPLSTSEPSFLLGVSNTDKSVRIYDSQRGSFLGRDWGHSQAINGVTLLEDEGQTRTVVSVGSDGTIMIWALDLSDPIASSMSRDPSPAKEPVLTSSKPTLRKVLSKAELAEFQRPSSSGGRRSPPRTISRRTSRYGLLAAGPRTPTPAVQTSPGSTIVEDAPSRRVSSGSGDSGTPPPVSPKSRGAARRPSLPALSTTPPTGLSSSISLAGPRKKQSTSSLRSSPALASSSSSSSSPYGFGTLSMATEQTCRTLRAYRKKLAAADSDPQQQPIRPEILAELDAELRLTAAALGDRAIRDSSSKAMNEGLLSGLLDTYSERLVSMLDEKLRLRASLGPPSPEIGTQTALLGQDTQRSSYSSTSSSDLNTIVT